MKRKALAIVLTLLMLVSVLPMGAFAASETDTTVPAEAETKAASYTDTEGHWGEAAIERWTQAKNSADQAVLEGMGNNTYAPDENLTRAQAMTIFSRLLNLVETADISKVTDVASDAWYAQWIEKGYAYEIIKGTSDTTFDPDGSITREQFFSIFARAMGIPGAEKCDKEFTDLDQVSSWFVEEGTVYAMVNAGYLDGYPDGSLQPKGNITRAEVAQVLANAIDSKGYIIADGTYDLTGMTDMVVVLAKNATLTGTYTGHIVSSCVNSTLYTTKVNPSTVKAAVNTAADNVKVSNVGVANPPYTPANPYNPSGANYVYVLQDNTTINPVTGGGSGGGGGGGGRVTTLNNNVTLTATTPFGSFILKANQGDTVSGDVSQVSAALSLLVKDANTLVNGVKPIEGVITKALNQLKYKDTTVTINGVDYYVEVNADSKITVTGTGADLDGHMKKLSEAFNKHMDSAAEVLGVTDNADWDKLVAAFDPYGMFKDYSATSMTYLDANAYAQKVIDVLDALNGLDTKVPDFVSKLETVIGNGAKYGLDWSGVTYAPGAQAMEDGKLVAGTSAFVSATLVQNDPTSFSNAVQDLVGLDITGYDDIMAIVGAGVKEARVCDDDYTLTVVVE